MPPSFRPRGGEVARFAYGTRGDWLLAAQGSKRGGSIHGSQALRGGPFVRVWGGKTPSVSGGLTH
jgi:hypothetical protein